MKDYYKILAIEKNASNEDIRRAYKKQSLKYHPDRNDGQERYAEIFKGINEAYRTLSNDNRRAEYDFRYHQFINQPLRQKLKTEIPNPFYWFKENKQGKKRRIIKTVLITLVCIAFIAISISLFTKYYNTDDDFLGENLEWDSSTKQAEESAGVLFPNETVKKEKKLPNPAKKDAIKVIPFQEEQTEALEVKEFKPKEANNIRTVEKELSNTDMDNILEMISAKRSSIATSTKCVKIIKTHNSNLINGFSVAQYLKNKGFTIAGRETIFDDIKGIHVNIVEGCLVVTLGKVN